MAGHQWGVAKDAIVKPCLLLTNECVRNAGYSSHSQSSRSPLAASTDGSLRARRVMPSVIHDCTLRGIAPGSRFAHHWQGRISSSAPGAARTRPSMSSAFHVKQLKQGMWSTVADARNVARNRQWNGTGIIRNARTRTSEDSTSKIFTACPWKITTGSSRGRATSARSVAMAGREDCTSITTMRRARFEDCSAIAAIARSGCSRTIRSFCAGQSRISSEYATHRRDR